MCGLFGIFQFNKTTKPDRDSLTLAAQSLSHRGPDYQGTYADLTVGFVHTRLSLLDLSPRSHQPFWDKNERYCLLYNGEIYNYQKLREDLESQGVAFRTTSDTEVLLECLLHDGIEETVKKIEGMFAFALYDKQEQTLCLARDRFGIKPLYIYQSDSEIIFSSEIMAMKHWIRFQPDTLSVLSFIQGFTQPTDGHSFYKDIKIFPAGHIFHASKNELARLEPYFETYEFWDDQLRDKYQNYGPDQIVDEVEQKLIESVEMQLVADIPVGGLCSGGLDSSIILAMAAKFHSNLAIFHADVVGPDSEYDAAKLLAKHLKLDLNVVQVADQDYLSNLPVIMEHYGHPFFRHPNSVPFYLVSKLIRQNQVKAVLSGEGADECYIGYPKHIFDLKNYLLHSLRNPLKTVSKCIAAVRGKPLLTSQKEMTQDIGNRFVYEEKMSRIKRYLDSQKNAYTPIDLKTLEMMSYHLQTLLHRNDALGMASSVEARFPFLDRELVRMAVNMPSRYKVAFSFKANDPRHYFLHDKWVLRKVADRYLPHQLAWRPKIGFPVDTFSRMNISKEFFRGSMVCDFLEMSDNQLEYLYENSNQTLRVRLLHLEVWMQVCLYHESRHLLVNRLNDHIAVG